MTAAATAKKIRDNPEATHSRADIEALHAHIAQKLLKHNKRATNMHFLEALMHETHSPEELAEFHADLDAEHAEHRGRMERRDAIHRAFSEDGGHGQASHQAVATDIHKLAQGLALIAEAIGGKLPR